MTDTTDKLHHLSLDDRGRWEMRITVEEGPVVIGKAIRIKLGKCSESEAIRRRDFQLRTLQKAGVTVKLRRQRRRK